MHQEDIDELLRREPFVPFRTFLTNGDHFDITRPQSVATGRTLLFVVLPDDPMEVHPAASSGQCRNPSTRLTIR